MMERRGRSPPSRGPSSHRLGGRGPPPPPISSGGYKVLCVSSLHPKASDDVVRDTLYREYKKYGDISVRVMHEPDERVAYVYFRSFDDARDAKHSKSRIILFDRPASVEAVYESASREEYERERGGRAHSLSPPPPRYRDMGGYGGPRGGGGRSPPPPDHRGGGGYRDMDYGYRDLDYDRRGPPPPRGPRGGPRDDYGRGPPMGPRGGHPRDDYGGRGPMRGPPPPRAYDHYGPPQNAQGGQMRRDNKKDKFPNYLDHIPPEEDPLATRTLFAGNLELNITDEEMRRIFGRYGELVDIDIKRPPPGTGNAYAFISFQNLDQAAAAKKELSGQYIGKFQCKIGYGKVNQTTKVWVGGLGFWASRSLLESEFDRFGAIQKVEYKEGDHQAYIQYESIDAATAAVNEMRGFPLGGPDKRIRMDFADVENMPPPRGYQGSDYDPNIARMRGRGFFHGGRGRGGGSYDVGRGYDDWGKRPGDDLDGPPSRMRKMDTRSPDDMMHHGDENGMGGMRRGSSIGSDGGGSGGVAGAKTVTELAKRLTADKAAWEGGLILKNSLFPTKMLLTEGEIDVVDQLMKDEAGRPHLKITQRLRLDQAKLDDVSKRISSSTSHAILLALTLSSSSVQSAEADILSRPLRNLVSYLKQKEAAGVITLTNSGTDQSGVLYAFPPCAFSLDLLRRVSSQLSDEGSKDDHLVVVVVRGG